MKIVDAYKNVEALAKKIKSRKNRIKKIADACKYKASAKKNKIKTREKYEKKG